ncbi:hypothetical protein T4D_13393 [Trichinella pseudospiralis]|uniref:Uncharacterized protein n=1 Tax=Trichinella pseudospiralis TaxID=6337 RepID=A0A0V1DKG4_TRIPS|nr:hypothetical protein T4D_13393 [Trichinella pseudospiralis]
MSAAVECLGLLCLSVARRWEEGTRVRMTSVAIIPRCK